MKQSIFNALLKVKGTILNSISNQDEFMKDVALSTSDDVIYSAEDYLAKAYNYTLTTIDDVSYSFSKTSASADVLIERTAKGEAVVSQAICNLREISLSEAISFKDPLVPDVVIEEINLSDIINQASIGESMNAAIVAANEKFLTSANATTTDILAAINNVPNTSISDINTLKQNVIDASIDGKVSNFAWANILKNTCSFLGGSVDSNKSVKLDDSSPFAIQSFINTVFTVIQTVWNAVINLLVLAFRGLLAIVSLVITAISSFVRLLGSDRITGSESSNDYIKGAIGANGSLQYNLPMDQTQLYPTCVYIEDSSLIEQNDIMRIQSGFLDYYIWKQNFKNANDKKLNMNCYGSPTFSYTRFLLAVSAWLEYDKANIFVNTGAIPNFDNQSSFTANLDIQSFISYLCDNRSTFLDDETSPLYIYLTSEELFRATIDQDFATWALFGSIQAQAFLSSNFPWSTNIDFTFSGIHQNMPYDFLPAVSSQSTPVDAGLVRKANASFSVLYHAIYASRHGVTDFKLEAYSSGNLSAMCTYIRNCIQEIIKSNNSADFIKLSGNYGIYSLGTDNTFSNTSIQSNWLINDLSLVEYSQDGSGNHYITINNETYQGTKFYVNPDYVDQLPAKGCYEIPDFSSAEVITAMLTIATLVAAAVVVKNRLSRTMQAKRQVKQALRAEKLNNYRKAYLSDPENREAKRAFEKQLKSYNRKAAFFGWPTYDSANGWFDFGSSSSAVESDSSSFLDSLFDRAQNAKKVETDINDGTSQIIQIISGEATDR